jgi:hypothetical protein
MGMNLSTAFTHRYKFPKHNVSEIGQVTTQMITRGSKLLNVETG